MGNYLGRGMDDITTANITVDKMEGDNAPNGVRNTLTISQRNIPSSINNITVYIDGVQQRAVTDFTLSNSTITFTTAPATGQNVVAVTKGDATLSFISDSTVVAESFADGAITNDKLVSFDASKLTGTFNAIDGSALTGITEVTVVSSDPTITTNPDNVGDIYVNSTTGEMFSCTDKTTNENVWVNVGGGSGQIPTLHYPFAALGERGLFAGGYDASTSSGTDDIQYITIMTLGNTNDFGNLNLRNQGGLGGASNGSRGCFGGGYQNNVSPVGYSDFIDYVTISTPGNATDFGNLTAVGGSITATSNGIRGLWGGGYRGSASTLIDYITISTTGNASTFGNLTVPRGNAEALANDTRGVWGGGENSGRKNEIDYVTVATTGNAFDFGDLSGLKDGLGSCSNNVRGLFAGGQGGTNEIEYITIMTTGNSNDFGDLLAARNHISGCGNGTRGVFSGHHVVNISDYVTIMTTGNAQDFGDMIAARGDTASCSGD